MRIGILNINFIWKKWYMGEVIIFGKKNFKKFNNNMNVD